MTEAKMRKCYVISALLLIILISFSSLVLCQSCRDRRTQPEKVMDTVGVKPGMIIGEAGAGRGYLTFKLSKRVGDEGKIYANDIDKSVLRAIENRCKREGVGNITTVVGEVEDPLFPETALDMIIMLHAFHDFTKKVEWLKNAKKYMKESASLVIIDRHDSHTRLNKKRVQEMGEEAGYILTQYETFLSSDYIYVFKIVK